MNAGLARLQELLEAVAGEPVSARWPEQLATYSRVELSRLIVDASADEVHAGLAIPTLGNGYVNPRLRVAEYDARARPAEETWWHTAKVSADIQQFFAGYLTSPIASEVPLLLVGHPGSGKSVFTKVLAARLPAQSFLPIRVELRHVPADAPIQDQIEIALRDATGERMDWPEVARAAGDALPVVLLDGFDELLQATEMSKADYLLQVRDFQRREAQQGRRVAVIVTSRIVVADRMRLPEGTILAKLEPFNNDQVRHWLAIWNDTNRTYLQTAGLRPLPASTVLAHQELAEQPLLLLLLALYDADGNGLQRESDQIAHADLYERLLTKFAGRELEKRQSALDEAAQTRAAERELLLLSAVAFAMFNRGKKTVSDDELEDDLTALMPQQAMNGADSGQVSRRLTRAQLAVGRFFFIHQSQALVDGTRLKEYEFLHSTFGEYLVARLVFRTLRHIVDLRAVGDRGLAFGSSTEPSDDKLWELLSFAPLTDGSQTVAFLGELFQVSIESEVESLRQLLPTLFRGSLRLRSNSYGGYAPRALDVTARHAAYSANLLVLTALAGGEPLSTGELLASGDHASHDWQRLALLWKSQLEPSGWEGLIRVFTVSGNHRTPDLTIHRNNIQSPTEGLPSFQTIDWLSPESPAAQSDPATISHLSLRPAAIADELAFLRIPTLSLLMHGIYPLLQGQASLFDMLLIERDGRTRSLLQSTLSLLLDDVRTPGPHEAITKTLLSALRLTSRAATGNAGDWMHARFVESADQKPNLASSQSGQLDIIPPSFNQLAFKNVNDDQNHTNRALLYASDSAVSAMIAYLSEGFHKLLEGDALLNTVDPMKLAQDDASLLSALLQTAHENTHANWAGSNGLTLLAVLPDEKLRQMEPADVAFILDIADKLPGRSAVVKLVRDRYAALRSERADRSEP